MSEDASVMSAREEWLSLLKFATQSQERILNSLITHGTHRAAAEDLGLSRGSVSDAINRLRKAAAAYKEAQDEDSLPASDVFIEGFKPLDIEEKDDVANVQVQSTYDRSDDEVIKDAKLDPSLWYVHERRKWTTTMKQKDEFGKVTPIQIWNYHFKFKRLAPKVVQSSVEQLMKNWEPAPLLPVHRSGHGDHMWEIDLFDAHFGKAAYNFDNCGSAEEISRDFVGAIHTLADRLGYYSPEKIILPLGNDFFQVDNFAGTTTKGTPVGGRGVCYATVFEAGFRSLEETIRYLREFAEVELYWVPGNHDVNASWHLCYALMQRFRETSGVTFEIGRMVDHRKYVDYGDCVIGYQHGDRMNPTKMLLKAPSEFPDWGHKKFREIHCGHIHKKHELRYTVNAEMSKQSVRYMSSLSVTDDWSWLNGYTDGLRAAEGIAWHKTEGPVGSANAFV